MDRAYWWMELLIFTCSFNLKITLCKNLLGNEVLGKKTYTPPTKQTQSQYHHVSASYIREAKGDELLKYINKYIYIYFVSEHKQMAAVYLKCFTEMILCCRHLRPRTRLFLFEDPPATWIFIADGISQIKLKQTWKDFYTPCSWQATLLRWLLPGKMGSRWSCLFLFSQQTS